MDELENNFLELWSTSFRKIPTNHFNNIVGLSGLLLGLYPLYFGPISGFAKDWAEFSGLMTQVYASLLGFIIAGYTVFVTSANPDFLVGLWRHHDEEANCPLLKLHLLVYMKLFLSIFSGTVFFSLIVIAYKIWVPLRSDFDLSPRLIVFLQTSIAAITGWRLTSAAIQVKAMIFNLYSLTITQTIYLSSTKDEETKR